MKYARAILPILFLQGCHLNQPVASSVDTSAMQAQMEAAIATANDATVSLEAHKQAQNLLDQAESLRLSKLKVNVTSASGAVDEGNTPVAQGELSIAKSRLVDVTPDPEEQIESARRAQLVAEGKTEQAKEAYGEAVVMASEKSAEIGRLEQKLSIATLDAEKAREEAQTALTKASDAQASVTAAIADSVRQEHDRMVQLAKKDQISMMNHFGGYAAIGALIAGIGIYWLGEGAVVACAALFLSSMLLFGYARFLNWQYYGWVVGGIVSIGVVGGVIYLKRISDHKSKSKELKAALEPVVNAIDLAYENCDTAGKKVIDDQILSHLVELGPAYDAIIKRVKATMCEEACKSKEGVVTQ
jgi:hypothetical protein